MSILVVPGRPARRFADAVDAGSTGHPTIAALASLAARLDAAPIAPAPDFRTALRSRLVAVAGVAAVNAVVPATVPLGVAAYPRQRPRPARAVVAQTSAPGSKPSLSCSRPTCRAVGSVRSRCWTR